MNKLTKSLFNKFIEVIFTLVITSLLSKIKTGNWLELLKEYWIVVVVILIVWNVFKRWRTLNNPDIGESIVIMNTSINEYEEIRKEGQYGMIWKVRIPKRGLSDINDKYYILKNFDIEVPPRCPDCETELSEEETFWKKYKVKCVGCGFIKKNKKSYYELSKDVKKIVKRDIEKEIEDKNVLGNRFL